MALGRFAIVVCVLLGGNVVAADDSPAGDVSARLVYQREPGAESCPSEEVLRAEVARRVGSNPFTDDAKRIIVCHVERTGHTLRARIEVGNDILHLKAARELVSKQADCQELSEALQVALSIAINPVVSIVRVDSEKEEESAAPEIDPVKRRDTEAGRSPAQEPASAVVASTPTRPGIELLIGADAAVAAGLNPGLSYATTVSIGFAGRRYSADADLRLVAPTSVSVGRGSLRVWQWAVLLATCAHRGAFSACLLGSGGEIYGNGQGFAISQKSQGPQVAAGARGAVEYPVAGRWLRLRAAVDLTVAVTRTHFAVGGVGEWISPPAAATLAVGLAGAFF
jgi:hypothetical protein